MELNIKIYDQNRAILEHEDHISGLPSLCLIEVLKNLTRLDIHNIMTVNKRMHALACDRSLQDVKWKNCFLSIAQTTRGYGFALDVDIVKDYPWGEDPRYIYEIYEDEEGKLVEKWKIIEKCDKDQLPKNIVPHNFNIPNKFFEAIKDILRYHNVENVRIQQCPSNAQFFFQLNDAFSGQRIDRFQCNCMISHLPVSRDTRTWFLKLIKTVKTLDLIYTPQDLVNEQFLCDIAEIGVENFYGDFYGRPPYVRLQYK
ncbi:hypothetical protein PMAYCL1PPCAC_20023 [Pristionchus mayeri]|uniref:F-box domain-containing protein n=1 Tax=Pristionchus mayeri TaxID=1317129 RepID=A0AAN5I2S6_9BILA|nr:hypothetical protein PMAYCL1PPCAC_20023 [Pristionchus mayeri]